MATDRGYTNTVLTRVYYTNTFLKRLANIQKDSYTILGFYLYVIRVTDQKVNTLEDVLYSDDLNNIANRIYRTEVDFQNFNMLNEQMLINIRVRDTASTFADGRATHIILLYETIDNKEPLKVTKYGLEFSNEYTDDYVLDENNIAAIIDWRDSSGTNILQQVTNDEQIRILLDLHSYRINTNLLSVHIPEGDGLDHSHGLSTLIELTSAGDELKFDENFTFASKTRGYSPIEPQTNTKDLLTVGLSPLVTIIDKNSETRLDNQTEITYEDWNDSIDFNYGEDNEH